MAQPIMEVAAEEDALHYISIATEHTAVPLRHMVVKVEDQVLQLVEQVQSSCTTKDTSTAHCR